MTSRTKAAIGAALLAPAIPCALLFCIFYQRHLGTLDLYLSAAAAFSMSYAVTMIGGIPWHLGGANRRLPGYILVSLIALTSISFTSVVFTQTILRWPLDPSESTDLSIALYGAVLLTALYAPVTMLTAWLFRSLALWLEGKGKQRGPVQAIR